MFTEIALVAVPVVVGYVAFKVGMRYQQHLFHDQLSNAGLLDEYVDSLDSDDESDSDSITLILERFDTDIVYAFCKETGKFLGQGTTIKELEEHIRRQLKDPEFRLPPVNSLNELMDNNLIN